MTPVARSTQGPRRRAGTLLLALLCVAIATTSLVEVARNRRPLAVLLPGGSIGLLAALAASSAVALAALLLAARALRRPAGEPTPQLPWRVAFEILVAGAVLHVLLLQPYRAIVARATLGVCAGIVALLILGGPRLAAAVPRRLRSAADMLAFSLALTLLCGELALSAWAGLSRSPLFAREDEAPDAVIARYRLDPGKGTPDFPVNSSGQFDAEFEARRPGAPLAACIGDSFSTGVVPHAFHFTTVAERLLGRGEVANMGFTGVGLNVYLDLVRSQAVPLRPGVVIVDVFVGNDLAEGLSAPHPVSWLQRALDQRQLLLAIVARRAARLAAGLPTDARPLGATAADAARGDAATRPRTLDELQRDFPWIADPTRETPGYSPEVFADIEQRRARAVCRPDQPPPWPRIHELLGQMRAACGDVPLAVLIIPDEFQVEDAVWDLVRAAPGGEDLDRDLPQRVLGAWLAEQGIPCLDLLPRLRAVAPLPDGRRHLYHLRDTHWNARGNDIAGQALAEFLAPWWR